VEKGKHEWGGSRTFLLVIMRVRRGLKRGGRDIDTWSEFSEMKQIGIQIPLEHACNFLWISFLLPPIPHSRHKTHTPLGFTKATVFELFDAINKRKAVVAWEYDEHHPSVIPTLFILFTHHYFLQ
jgi:hypothetical protein